MKTELDPASLTLSPYIGKWEFPQAAHLLRRTMFGATSKDIASILKMTMSKAVDTLLADQPISPSDLPLIWYHGDLTRPNDGQTWVGLPYDNTITNNDFNRGESLGGWWMSLLLSQNISIREKMTLFWHNHFACGMTTVNDARYMYKQNVLLRTNALGNFKSLAKAITLDPAMLRYLSGNKNIASAPNENYGRELQELFTIGKGVEVSTGDYTTYTEADVKAAAHVLTGWKDDPVTVSAIFTAANHDPADKQFSPRYGNKIIKGSTDQAGANREIDDLLTMIFSETATAQYICRKIYRWFVDYVVDATVEQNVIAALAQTLITNNFEIKPVMSQLLKSSLFYDGAYTGCIIKTPLDLIAGTIRVLGVKMPDNSSVTTTYYGWIALRLTGASLQMELLEPPNVAGWSEYYEAPQYHELWINSGTLDSRIKFLDDIITNKYQIAVQTSLLTSVDLTLLAQQLSDPTDPVKLVADLANLFYPNQLSAAQLQTLHDQLIGGYPDNEWTTEWGLFMSDPINKKAEVTTRLTTLIKYMLELAEYQLM